MPADRYDPKFSVRPPGDRKTVDTRNQQGPVEDPLAELARIVAGRSPFDAIGNIGARTEKQTAAPSAPAQPVPSEAELARDLEAELLNELQASFAAIPDVVGRPAPPPAEPTPAPYPAAAASPKAPPPPPLTFDASDISASEAELSFRPPATAAPAAPGEAPARQPSAPTRGEPQIRPPQGVVKRESLATRMARAANAGEPAVPATVRSEPPAITSRAATPPPVPRPNGFKPLSPPVRSESAAVPFRPTLAPNPPAPTETPEPPHRPAASRWDPPSEPSRQPPALDLARFAPANRNGADHEERAVEAALPAVEEAFFEDEQDNETVDMVPGYGDEELLPFPEEEFAYEGRRSRRGPLAIAALLTIAVVGGAAAVMLRSGSDETPPVIAADSSPTKVAPDNVGASEGEGQGKLIYDRVDPRSEVAASELVVPGDDPIADIPPIPEDSAGNDVSRVILEGGPGPALPDAGNAPTAPMDLSEGTTVADNTASDPEPIGPKKVRTVVVRPDGTIVSSTATPAEEAAETAPDLPPASETPPAPAADENPLLADDFGVETIDGPAPPSAPAPEPPAGTAESASVPDMTPAPPPPAAKTPASAKPPTVVATTGGANGPIDLTPGKPATTTRVPAGSGAPAGSGGGFLVQVSSQRSQEIALATFRDLQRRYPSILGDRAPDIQRADLGERGVYYRVRVGYPTRDEAIRMCENLKSAGGDCILATR